MQTVTVDLAERAYPIHIGRGGRRLLGDIVNSIGDVHQVVIIADERVAALHLESLIIGLQSPPTVVTVPAGEASKSLDGAARLFDRLADARIERGDVIVTLGGGMVGDLGGFVAATWLRGVRFIQVPTTLEAAIDASVGGKTAANHTSGKNLIGVFHQPAAVLIDTDFLSTLPQRDYIAGLSESVKHAAIRDPALLHWQAENAKAILSRVPAVLTELIARNCAIKADVVAHDERERNVRAILNYGHTVGHAIEHLLGYQLRHGECVALGMIAANRLACARELLDQEIADCIADVIATLGLPQRLPRALDAAAVAEVCKLDKKVRGGSIHFVLLRDLGATERVTDVSDAEIAAALSVIQPRD